MKILTAADHGRTVACRCRTTNNWVIGQVHATQDGNVRVLVNRVVRPLQAFIEILKVVTSGMLTLMEKRERLKALLCLDTNAQCRFIAGKDRAFALREFRRFVADPAR
jgi:hypothetical protein